MASPPDNAIRAGNRTLLLWILWLVMAALLFAAGLIAFPSEPLPAPAVPAVPAKPAATPAKPVGSAAAVGDVAAPPLAGGPAAAAPDRTAVPDAAPQRAHVLLRLRDGDGGTVPLPRGVLVEVRRSGSEAERLRRIAGNMDAADWTFAVPAGTRLLQFTSIGFRPIEVALPSARGAIAELGALVFEAEAALLVRLSHAAEELQQDGSVQLGNRFGACVAEAPLRWRGGAAEVRLPAPAQQDLRLHVALPAGMALQLPAAAVRQPKLQPGEQRTVEVDLAAMAPMTLRLGGIAAELLPHLPLRLFDADHRERDLPPPADGCVRLFGAEGSPVQVLLRASRRSTTVQLMADGGRGISLQAGLVLTLVPEQPLLGIALRGDDGSSPPFRLGMGAFEDEGPLRPVQVVGVELLASSTQLFVGTERERWLFASSVLQGSGPLRWLPLAAAQAMATVRARPRAPLPERHGFHVSCEPVGREQATVVLLQDGDAFASEQVPPGRYRVRLWHQKQPAGELGEIDVQPGGDRELAFDLPAVLDWRGAIGNWQQLDGVRPESVIVDGRAVPVEADGTFVWPRVGTLPAASRVVCCFADPQHGKGWRLQLPADQLEIDAAAAQLRLSAPAVQALALAVPRLGDGELVVMLGEGERWTRCKDGRALVAAATPLRGFVQEPLRLGQQVTAWFDLPAGTRQASLDTGAGARWISVFVERPFARGAVRVHGPDGMPAVRVGELQPRQPLALLLVDGTRAVDVELDGALQTFPAPTGDLIVY